MGLGGARAVREGKVERWFRRTPGHHQRGLPWKEREGPGGESGGNVSRSRGICCRIS